MAREINEMMYIKCLAHCPASKYPIPAQDMPESFTYYPGEKNWKKRKILYLHTLCYNVLIEQAVS